MPDAPDGYKYQPYSQRAVLGDMAELAVRLGSPIVHDRRGTVIWYDQGDYGLAPWVAYAYGTGGAMEVDTHRPLYGGFNIKLTSGSTDPWMAVLYRNIAIPRLNKWGLAVLFSVEDDYEYVSVNISRYDGVNRHQARIRIYDADNTIKYRNSDGDDVLIATLGDLTETYSTYHWLKLVADFEDDEYVRLMFDDTEYDLSGEGIYVSASAELAQFRPYFIFVGTDGNNDNAYLDAVVVTIDEP